MGGTLHNSGLTPGSIIGAAPAPARRTKAAESWTVTAADVDAWLQTAPVGATLVYAHGPEQIRGAAFARIQQLTKAGEVVPHCKRTDDGGFDYVVRRNRVRIVRPPVCDPQMMAVLLVIQDAAQNNQVCPSDNVIGEAADLSLGQVKWAIDKLKAAGFIRATTQAVPGNLRFRTITVIATGATTAGPQA